MNTPVTQIFTDLLQMQGWAPLAPTGDFRQRVLDTTNLSHLNILISPLCCGSSYTNEEKLSTLLRVSGDSLPLITRLVFLLSRLMALWIPDEEDAYLPWVARHEHLTWLDRAKSIRLSTSPEPRISTNKIPTPQEKWKAPSPSDLARSIVYQTSDP